MVARLHRTTALLLWALAALWFAVNAHDGHWIGAFVGALLLLNIQPLLLAVEFFVLMPWINRHDPAPRPTPVQLVRAWWKESLTAHEVFGWHQPFRAHAHPDAIDMASAGRRAVVLVHGFFCNRGVWNRWVPALRASDVPWLAISMEPPFDVIESCVAQVDVAIERARRATGMPPLVVCHSMGGLALRAWWRAHAASAASRVHGVITVGTPHQGTFMARMASGDNARQMRLGSQWLSELAAGEGDGRRQHFTCFYSHCDNITMPTSNAALPGADNRHVEGYPHVAMLDAPEVWSAVLQRLREPAAARRA